MDDLASKQGISPVIGVILMIAVVVALVGLVSIAAFDVTNNGQYEETSKASVQVSSTQGTGITVQMIDKKDTSEVIVETVGGEQTISETGDAVTVDSFGKQVNVIGVTEDGSRSVIRSVNPSESSGGTTTSDYNTTFVDPESSTTSGSIDGNSYNTLEAAENDVSTGDSIIIRSGVHRDPGTVQATVEKDVTIGVQENVIFECDTTANNGKVNLNFTRTPAVVNGAQNIATRGCGSAELPPPLEDQFSVTLNDLTVASGSQATFSANISDIGQEDIESITWDFGDGSGSTGNPVTNIYSSTGDYTVTVEVTSKEGTTESDTATYNVESSPTSIDPVAAFDYSPVGPTVNQRIEFNASSSTDQDGNVNSYNWDLDDDGLFESSGLTATKVYNSTGEKNVRLQVEDNNGNTDKTIQSVLVDSTGDVDPEFSVNLSDKTIPVNELALFSANTSSIGVSQVQNVNWLFGDGSSATGNPAFNTYDSTGDYTATVEVTSERGVTNSDSATVTVVSNPPTEQIVPQPAMTITPENPVTGEQVTFNGDGSQDIDGVITSYEWDLDNDGTFERNGSEVTRSYSYIAEQDVQLKVTDNDGNSNTTTSSVLVSSDASSGDDGGGDSCGCVYSDGDSTSVSGGSSNIIVTGVVEVNPRIDGATVRVVDVDSGEVIDTSTTNSEGEYAVVAEESSDEIRVVTENDQTLNGRDFYASAERQVADRVAVDFNFTETVNSTVNDTPITVAYSVSQENTYKQVGTPYEVQAMSEDLDGTYRLIRDIDMSGTSSWNSGSGFNPIATGDGPSSSDDFTGTIRGENHSIKGLYVDRQDISLGLVSQAYNAEIRNLDLYDVDINHDSTESSPNGYTGGLYGSGDDVTVTDVEINGSVESLADVSTGGVAGEVFSTRMSNVRSEVDVTSDGDTGGIAGSGFSGTIDRSSASGSITSNQDSAGGLLGRSRQTEMEVKRSYATGDVTGDSATGGLIGFMRDGKVSESFASGSVVSNNGAAGGLVGNATGTASTGGYIEKSYAVGSVEGGDFSGGLVGSLEESSDIGFMEIRDSFATGSVSDGSGGLIGRYSGSRVSDSYWDVESTSAPSSDAGTGLTTGDMQGYTPSPIGADTMSGLDFDNTWDTVTGNYPILRAIDSQEQVVIKKGTKYDLSKYVSEYHKGCGPRSFGTTTDAFEYFVSTDGGECGGEIMVGTMGGQIDLSNVEKVKIDWQLNGDGRGAANFGVDSKLSNIKDDPIDSGITDRSKQYKNSGGFSRTTDSLDVSAIKDSRHIGAGLEASSSRNSDHTLYVYSIYGVDSDGNTVFEIKIPESYSN